MSLQSSHGNLWQQILSGLMRVIPQKLSQVPCNRQRTEGLMLYTDLQVTCHPTRRPPLQNAKLSGRRQGGWGMAHLFCSGQRLPQQALDMYEGRLMSGSPLVLFQIGMWNAWPYETATSCDVLLYISGKASLMLHTHLRSQSSGPLCFL